MSVTIVHDEDNVKGLVYVAVSEIETPDPFTFSHDPKGRTTYVVSVSGDAEMPTLKVLGAKCTFCGQWGKPHSVCEFCGAPIE